MRVGGLAVVVALVAAGALGMSLAPEEGRTGAQLLVAESSSQGAQKVVEVVSKSATGASLAAKVQSKAAAGQTPTTTAANKPIVIVSTSVGAGKAYCDLTESNHREYARKHGYEYHRYTDAAQLSQEALSNPKWTKLLAILKHLGHGQQVVWMDSDIVVTNMGIKFEDILSKYNSDHSRDILITRGALYKTHPEARINNGIFIMQDTQWTRDFMQDVLHKGAVPNNELVDQPRMIEELLRMKQLDATPHAEQETHEHLAIIPQRVMNSFLREGDYYAKHDSPESRWQPGDFVAHVNGMATSQRQRLIRKALSETVTARMMQVLLSEPALDPALAKLTGESALVQHASSAGNAVAPTTAGLSLPNDVVLSEGLMDRLEDAMRADVISALVSGDFNTAQSLAF